MRIHPGNNTDNHCVYLCIVEQVIQLLSSPFSLSQNEDLKNASVLYVFCED